MGTVPLLQLMQTKGIGPRSLGRLLDRLEQAGLSLDGFTALEAEEIAARFDLSEEQISSLHANLETAVQLAERLKQQGVQTVLRSDPSYPERLKTVLADKSPPVLFIAGTPSLLEKPAVGFCGARDASEQALRRAEQLAAALAKQDVLVVSGHAHGVD